MKIELSLLFCVAFFGFIKTNEADHICGKPKDAGPCKAIHPRFYFDSNEQNCKEFNYGGCLGNENNFEELSDCEDKCGNSVRAFEDNTNICIKPKDKGPCQGMFPRFYFDSVEQNCKKFFYGGCEGNANNFESERECEAKCENIV